MLERKLPIGSQVFVFFQAGDVNKPVYFAVAQSGPGWFSQHPNQHVFQSDNIRIRIDQQPAHKDSTCKFNPYIQENSIVSKTDVTKKDMLTRLDIQVLAKDINAVNIQIHGDVNMKILGDWWVHHKGDKHETHIGNYYIKHIGDTYVQQQGDSILQKTGNISKHIDGSVTQDIDVDVSTTIWGNLKHDVFGNSQYYTQKNFQNDIGGDYLVSITGNQTRTVLSQCNIKIVGNTTLTLCGDLNMTVGGFLKTQATDSISISTENGNIDIITLGKFQIVDENNNITAIGYNNIGTLGNINIRSTFGNIGIKTVQNKIYADFQKEYVCAPWNPSFLKQLSTISQVLPGFSTDMVLQDISGSASNVISWLLSLNINILFDGFPTFLPCKMIMQNPNISAPAKAKNAWIEDFRSIDINWNSVTNTTYWKLISKVIGNIDISSWSGDITVKTQGTLGNAGNINLYANNKYGGLPGYQCGNINMTADTPFRIFTDPRDLFFDSNLYNRFMGKFYLFSSNSSSNIPMLDIPVNTIKPFKVIQMIAALLGLPAQFGFVQQDSHGGGCIKCITDVLHSAINSLGGFSLLPFNIAIKPFIPQNTNPTHKFNSLNNSLVQPIYCDSSNLLKGESNGFGHAVDIFKLGQGFETFSYRMGGIYLNGVGSSYQHFGKNYKIYADQNGFQFGIENKLNTGWIQPKLDLSLPVPDLGIMIPTVNCVAIIKENTITQSYKASGRNFGSYKNKYTAVTKSGIYPLAAAGAGKCIGNTLDQLVINLPYINTTLSETQLVFTAKPIITQPYKIPYTYNTNVPFQLTTILQPWYKSIFMSLYTTVTNSMQFNTFATTVTASQQDQNNTSINNIPNFMNPLVSNVFKGSKLSFSQAVDGSSIASLAGFSQGRNAVTIASQELLSAIEQAKKKQQEKAQILAVDQSLIQSKTNFTLGKPQKGFGIVFKNVTTYKEFQQDMPAFSNAAATLGNAADLVKPFFPGVGDAVSQLLKGLPQTLIKKDHTLQISLNPLFSITGHTEFSADLLLSTQVAAGGIVIPPGNPLLYGQVLFGIPNIAKLIDPLFAGGTSVSLNPIQLVKTLFQILSMASDGPNKLLADLKCEGKIGIGAPGFIADLIGKPDIGYIRAGLDKPVTPFIKMKVLEPVRLVDATLAACLQPPSISINPMGILTLNPLNIASLQLSDNAPAITGDVHLLGTGCHIEGKITKSSTKFSVDANVLRDIIDDTYLGNIHGQLTGPGPLMITSIQSSVNVGKIKRKRSIAIFNNRINKIYIYSYTIIVNKYNKGWSWIIGFCNYKSNFISIWALT